jgi:hypothetical protein
MVLRNVPYARRLGYAFDTRAPPAPRAAAVDAPARGQCGRGGAGGTSVGVAPGASWGLREAGSRCWAKGGISPGALSPPGRAQQPDPVPVTGAPWVRRREHAPTLPRKCENSRHGKRIGSFGKAVAPLIMTSRIMPKLPRITSTRRSPKSVRQFSSETCPPTGLEL